VLDREPDKAISADDGNQGSSRLGLGREQNQFGSIACVARTMADDAIPMLVPACSGRRDPAQVYRRTL
jgi:hypothetical protein